MLGLVSIITTKEKSVESHHRNGDIDFVEIKEPRNEGLGWINSVNFVNEPGLMVLIRGTEPVINAAYDHGNDRRIRHWGHLRLVERLRSQCHIGLTHRNADALRRVFVRKERKPRLVSEGPLACGLPSTPCLVAERFLLFNGFRECLSLFPTLWKHLSENLDVRRDGMTDILHVHPKTQRDAIWHDFERFSDLDINAQPRPIGYFKLSRSQLSQFSAFVDTTPHLPDGLFGQTGLLAGIVRIEPCNQDEGNRTAGLHSVGPVFLVCAPLIVIASGYIVMFVTLRRDGARLFWYGLFGLSMIGAGWFLIHLSLPMVEGVFEPIAVSRRQYVVSQSV